MFYFYTSWKRQTTKGFVKFSEGIKKEYWAKMGWGTYSVTEQKHPSRDIPY